MKKSVLAFVLGLIFSIIGAISTLVFNVAFIFVAAFTTGTLQSIATIVPYINLIALAISLVGSFICLSKAKIGGIIMMISAILSIVCFIMICIAFKTINPVIIFFWMPTFILFLTSIVAIKKK